MILLHPFTCSHALLGMCVHSLGQYYLAVGDYSEATLAFREALDIARQVYGEEDLQVPNWQGTNRE